VQLSGIDLSDIDGLFPDVSSFMDGALEAKNELAHLCKEVEEFDFPPPTIEDVIHVISESVFGEGTAATDIISETRRRRALRAKHLPRNRYTRPRSLRRRRMQEKQQEGYQGGQRRLQENINLVDNLVDSLSVTGGYDGTEFFLQLDLDVSKQIMDGLETIIQKPLSLLNEIKYLSDLFPASGETSSIDLPFGTFEFDADFAAGARLSVRTGFEITGEKFSDISSMNETDVSKKLYLQILEASAKFEVSASVDADLSIAGIADLKVENGTIAFALGIGIEEAS